MALGFVRRKRFRITIGVIAMAVVSLFLAFRLSPWSDALLIRQVFENEANNVLKEMETHAAANVASILHERCRAGDGDA